MSDYSQNLRVFIVGCPNGNRIAQKLMTKLSETADKIDTIEKQRDALLAAMKKYGNHLHACKQFLPVNYDKPCTCGFYKAIAEVS